MKLPAGSSALLALPLTLGLTACPFTPDPTPPSPVTTCTLTATDWARIESPGHSAARQWNELALHGIRSVLPSPTAHARTLYHLSAATFDTWAASQPGATGVFSHEKLNLTPQQTEVALNHAAFRVLTARFGRVVPGLARCFEQHMTHLRLNPADTATSGAAPAAFGNRVAQTVLDAARTDGANEWQLYRHVIFPLLAPITLSAMIILGHISLKIFDLIFAMAGADNATTDVPALLMYLRAFRANQFAEGAAIAIVLLLLVALVIIPYLYSSLRSEVRR